MVEKKNSSKVQKTKYAAPALDKGLDIIEYLSTSGDEGENLTSIASGIGKSNNEIFRMVAVLEERGFVDRMPESDRYMLSDKLFQLGLSRPKKKNLIKLVTPAMENFAHECENACHLSIKSGSDVVVVSRVESPLDVGIAVRIGHRLPLARAPSGRCIVAFSRDDQIRQIVADVKASEGVKSAKEFQSAISQIQRIGYSIMKDGFSVGVTGLSAPILDVDTGQCVAAITSPVLQYVHSKNTDLEKIASRLRYYADSITKLYSNCGPD